MTVAKFCSSAVSNGIKKEAEEKLAVLTRFPAKGRSRKASFPRSRDHCLAMQSCSGPNAMPRLPAKWPKRKRIPNARPNFLRMAANAEGACQANRPAISGSLPEPVVHPDVLAYRTEDGHNHLQRPHGSVLLSFLQERSRRRQDHPRKKLPSLWNACGSAWPELLICTSPHWRRFQRRLCPLGGSNRWWPDSGRTRCFQRFDLSHSQIQA